MKKISFFLGLQLLVAMAFAQTMPCPTIVSSGVTVVGSTGSTCTFRIDVNAQGDVGAPKSLKVEVYLGSASGTPYLSECFVVPPSPSDATYSTSTFTAPCTATITYVITRYTSSNGRCQGGTCGAPDTLDNSGGPLPISLIGFNAKRNNGNVLLVWKTSFEQNVSEFIIQRRQGGAWVDVASVPATNLANGSSYSYTDMNNSKGVTEYRLKTVDLDAKYVNSDVRSVKGNGSSVDFIMYPNPTSGTAKVSITDIAENTELQVTDNSGRIVKTINMVNTNSADISGLQKGIYMIRLVNKTTGDVVVKKLTVIN